LAISADRRVVADKRSCEWTDPFRRRVKKGNLYGGQTESRRVWEAAAEERLGNHTENERHRNQESGGTLEPATSGSRKKRVHKEKKGNQRQSERGKKSNDILYAMEFGGNQKRSQKGRQRSEGLICEKREETQHYKRSGGDVQ